MLINNTFHYTYCTNTHGGENWEITLKNLKEFVPSIKKEVAPDAPFGLGLRLSNKASEELQIGDNIIQFKDWLNINGLYVFTMNGFPYGNFHNEVVKDKVHAPDWTTKDRVIYTKRLFDQLAFLLPQGQEGGISTSPISYKHWHKTDKDKKNVLEEGAKNMATIILHLLKIENETNKYLHLDIEPEPDGMLENTAEFLSFYNQYLLPIAGEIIHKSAKISIEKAKELIYKYITICYDVCHFSLAFEEPEHTFNRLKKENIKIGKIQISAALKIIFDGQNDDTKWASLSHFNEPTYLHQVTEKTNNLVTVYKDLPFLLKNKKSHKELRVHFHVPIFLESFDHLMSTQDQILKVIDYLKKESNSNHLEIETYTWDVLPDHLKTNLDQSICRELKWLKEKF